VGPRLDGSHRPVVGFGGGLDEAVARGTQRPVDPPGEFPVPVADHCDVARGVRRREKRVVARPLAVGGVLAGRRNRRLHHPDHVTDRPFCPVGLGGKRRLDGRDRHRESDHVKPVVAPGVDGSPADRPGRRPGRRGVRVGEPERGRRVGVVPERSSEPPPHRPRAEDQHLHVHRRRVADPG